MPVLFYTLSVGQQPRYILPVLPPLAVLVARTLVSRLAASDAEGRRHVGVAVALTASAVAFLALAFLLFRARPLLFALSPLQGQIGTAIIVVAALGLLAWTWFGRQRWLPAAVAISAAATLVTLQFTFYSGGGPEPVQLMAQRVLAIRQGEPSGTYRMFVRNLVFYTGVKQNDLVDEAEAVEFLRQPQRVLCVMPLKLVDGLQRDHGLQLHRLASFVYFNPVGGTPAHAALGRAPARARDGRPRLEQAVARPPRRSAACTFQEDLAGIEHAVRIERLLDAPHQRDGLGRQLQRQVPRLAEADAVLAGHRAFERDHAFEQRLLGGGDARLDVGIVGVDHDVDVDVAVADVAEGRNQQP